MSTPFTHRQQSFGSFLEGTLGWFEKHPPATDYERGMKKALEMAQREWGA